MSSRFNFRKDSCVHGIVEAHAERNPQATAISFPGGSLSYEELNNRASFLAHYLGQVGVDHRDVVALAMQRSPEMIISMLAILKCGAAYLPLEENSPVARLKMCLDDANVALVISDRSCDELCDGGRINIRTDADRLLFSTAMREFSTPGAQQADGKAYVMFTSGSTGKPKGVVIPHRAIARLVIRTNYIEITAADKILQLSPPSFDASTFEIWGALLNGATLVLYSAPVIDPSALRRDIENNGVTILWLTAALFHLIGDRYVDALRPLKILLAGGDVLNPKIVNKILDAIPGITVINGYGPTENTTFTCCHVITAANRPSMHGVPIGRAITGTEVLVLNDSLETVPQGEVGELFATGRGVALGYLDGDHGGFFSNPAISEGTIYRTGDLVRENSKGDLEFIGRRDNQVKVRGFRISLEEIKAGLLEIDDVVDAVVFVHKEASGDQLLVAYVRTRSGSDLDVAQTRHQLSELQLLPAYMMPDKIVLSEVLPVTPNGKLDKNLLISLTT